MMHTHELIALMGLVIIILAVTCLSPMRCRVPSRPVFRQRITRLLAARGGSTRLISAVVRCPDIYTP